MTYPDPVVLHWQPLDGAAKYEIVIGDDASLSGATPLETSATSYSPPAWLSPGQHWWAVAAKDAEGAFTPYSTPISFTWDWPSTVSGLTVTDGVDGTGDPVADDAIFEPRFSWDTVPGAAKYDLDVSTDTNFASGSTTHYTTIATTYSPLVLLANADYYWRVRATDPNNDSGDWTYGDDQAAPGDSFSETFDTNAPLSVSNLRMTDNNSDPGADEDGDPNNGYQTSEPIVQWDPVPGAGGYVVDVRLYGDTLGCDWSSSGIRWTNTTEDTAWTPLGTGLGSGATVIPGKTPTNDGGTKKLYSLNDPNLGRYCVRVKPVRATGFEAPWTYLDPNDDGSTWAFQYAGPPVGNPCSPSCQTDDYLGDDDYLTPQSGSTSTAMPLFTWNPIDGKASYYVVVATDAAMTHVVDYAWTQLPAYAPRVTTLNSYVSYPDSTTNYYWQVFPAVGSNGSGANGVPGNGTRPAFLKETIPPVPVAPLTGDTVDGDVTFKWLPVSGATRYQFQVSDDVNFPTTGGHILETAALTYATSYTSPINSFKTGTLYWRVQAIDAKGTGLSWSVPQTFTQTYDPPSFDTITNPTQGAMIPVLKWNPVPNAISYDVDLICSMQGAVCNDGNGMETTAATMTRLTGIGVVGWRVRANFAKQFGVQPSQWSATQSFTRTIPDPTGPYTLHTGTGVLLGWNPMPGAQKYKVEISRANSFSTLIGGGSFTTDNTSWAPTLTTTDYLNGGTFYWRVRTLDGDSNYGQPSPAQLMTLPAKLAETTSVSFLHRGKVNTVTVTVKDFAGHVIPGARVTASGAGLRAVAHLTGPKGGAVFKIKPTKTGYVNFVATKTGYQSVTKQLHVM